MPLPRSSCGMVCSPYPEIPMAEETTQPLPTFSAQALIDFSRNYVNHRALRGRN